MQTNGCCDSTTLTSCCHSSTPTSCHDSMTAASCRRSTRRCAARSCCDSMTTTSRCHGSRTQKLTPRLATEDRELSRLADAAHRGGGTTTTATTCCGFALRFDYEASHPAVFLRSATSMQTLSLNIAGDKPHRHGAGTSPLHTARPAPSQPPSQLFDTDTAPLELPSPWLTTPWPHGIGRARSGQRPHQVYHGAHPRRRHLLAF